MKKYFVKEWRNLLLIMTRVMNQWWRTRQTWTSEFQDYHIPLWSDTQSTSVRELIQKIENHPNRHVLQQDLRQNHLIHSVQNQNKWFRTEPKTQCKVCLSYWDIGIVYCTCGHFLRKGRGENQKFISTRWTLFQFPSTSSRKGDLTDSRYGKKPSDREYYSDNQQQENVQEEVLSVDPW